MSVAEMRLLLVLAVIVVQGARVLAKCPDKCFCNVHLTSVNCGGKRLTDLPDDIPLQVEKLYLNNNKFTALGPYAFSNFSRLMYLDLRQNYLQHIEAGVFAKCSQLQQLYLTANHIETIHPEAFEGSEQITYLSLGANKLSNVPSLPPLVHLQSLIMEGNKIMNATFPESYSANTDLTDIVMSNNALDSLTNATFQSLRLSHVKKVEISRSHIQRVESGAFEPLKMLQSLKIGYNPLDSLQLQNVIRGLSHTSLVSLDIRNLSLGGRLPSETFRLLRDTPISSLKMQSNQISNIPSGAFANLPKLILIDLSGCKIQTISESAFENLTVLQTLFLYANSLAKVPRGLPSSLTKLNLNQNQIDKLRNSDFDNLKILEELNLVKNSISELQQYAFLGLMQLQKLHLGQNRISTLPGKLFNMLTRLVSLELNGNNIKFIPESEGRFSSLASLVYLNLDSNALSEMPLDLLHPLESLVYLHLDNNQLGPLLAKDKSGELFQSMAKLKELHLRSNDIHSLPEPMLAEQKSLTILDLSNNKLSHWEHNFFVSTESLRTLDLSMNLISLINETSLSNLGSLQSLNLSGNPFACTCGARWFCGWMNSTDIVLPQRSLYTCNLPPAWQGKVMSSYCKADIDCTDYTVYYIIGAVFGGCMFAFVIFLVCYRYRWYVRYRCFRIKRGLRRVGRSRKDYTRLPGNDKLYDIYVSYADKDREWVLENIIMKFDEGECAGCKCEGQYRTCFKERDFNPGRGDISNMDECINASASAMVIATDEYVTCKWCQFEFDTLVDAQVKKVISPLILVKVGNLHGNIPKLMERMIQRHEYIEWISKDTAEANFLERVTDQIAPKVVGGAIQA
ncbi:insulin-like growth factor-binding protein complex acid labile subunit [Haliotis asinina]|uniref:insulin-like growth factor-binding protein complex acid labile subunit n=1 Tax=Haliotis asinina TaxID=109174 RepID=UPI003532361B